MDDSIGVVRLGMPGDKKPEPKDFEKFLTEYCLLWKPIGLNLGLKLSLLNVIEADHHQNRKCFRKMLENWLQMDPRATWSTLELAITNANRQNLGYDPLERMPVESEKPPADVTTKPATTQNKYSDLEPEMYDLNDFVIPKIQAEWEDVAFALRYKIHTVRAIKEKHREDPRKCCSGLLQDWLTTENGKSPKTWSTLLDALRKVNELASVTREIEKDLSKLN